MIVLPDSVVMPTPDDLRPVEVSLLNTTGGHSVVWCGRATTALYWAYRVAAISRAAVAHPEIIMPAMMCASPANAAFLAGAVPRFADSDSCTGMVTLEHIQARATPNTCAVVVVHLFGSMVEIEPIAAWCRQHQIVLIEDVAQALGAHYRDGAPVGSKGDMVVYSFNSTKIMESGNAALALNNENLAETLAQVVNNQPLPREPHLDTLRQLALSSRNLHHSLVAVLRLGLAQQIDVSPLFLQLQQAYNGLYLRPAKLPTTLADDWQALPESLARRYRRAEQYAEALRGGPWLLLEGWRESGVCWRFSLLFDSPEQLVTFSESVRRDGFHVSNLYWPINQLFRPQDVCLAADSFARRIVNLCVNDTVDEKWIKQCCASLWRHAALSDPN